MRIPLKYRIDKSSNTVKTLMIPREKIMEEQHTFWKFGYFHVPRHKYQVPAKEAASL